MSLKYFDCEPFEQNFRTHVLGGFWPLETDVKWKKVLFSIYSYLCFFSMTSMAVIQVLDIYLLRNNLVQLTRDLCTIPIHFAIVMKSYLYMFQIDRVNELKGAMNEYKNTRTDTKDVEILERSNKVIIYVMKSMYALAVPCILMWIVYPAIDSSEGVNLLFPYLPIKEWTTTIYVTIYVYQAVSIFWFMLNAVSVDLMFSGFVVRICAHYDIIMSNFKKIDKLKSVNEDDYYFNERIVDERALRNILRKSVQLHQKVIWELTVFNKIFKSLSLVHFIGVSVVIGAVVIDTIVFFQGFKLKIIQRMVYLMTAMWDTFLYCFSASKLYEKSYELGMAAYSTKWYKMRPANRKDILFVIMQCQRPPKLTVGNMFSLQMRSFTSVLDGVEKAVGLFTYGTAEVVSLERLHSDRDDSVEVALKNLLKASYDAVSLLYQTTKKKSLNMSL